MKYYNLIFYLYVNHIDKILDCSHIDKILDCSISCFYRAIPVVAIAGSVGVILDSTERRCLVHRVDILLLSLQLRD
jgi:hypothetical protein